MRELESLQRWLQAVITHSDSVEAGILSPEACSHLEVSVPGVESVVGRSTALTAVERLGIYRQSYYLRLVECLRAEFPAVLAALGEELFDEFAADYLESYPPRSYTLNGLGGDFPVYLAQNRDRGEGSAPGGPSWVDFLVDLASFERAVTEVFDGPGLEGRQPQAAGGLDSVPPDRWPEARLRLAPCLRLLPVGFPVHRYFRLVQAGMSPPIPQASACYLAVFRRSYVVRTARLSRVQHDLLSALSRGLSLATAIAHALPGEGDARPRDEPNLRRWFFNWSRLGFIESIEFH
jgi:hypothetical protein